jgi:dienelactone hydrolase
MSEQTVKHEFRGETLVSVLVGTGGASRATVICFPTVMGVTDLELGFARELAARGFDVLVADLFGRRFTPVVDREAAFAAMSRLRGDRVALRDRLLAVLDVAREQGAERIAATGYCFGGQCALDLARSGADIAGVASFHGLFDPTGLESQPIKAKVIAFHGWDDPMVPPDAVVALGKELTEAGADWQIHAYGHVGHGFTNPKAHQIGIEGVAYNAAAARRSWASLNLFLDELFG